MPVFSQYKKPPVTKTQTLKDMSDFIVDTDECSSSEKDEVRSIFKKPAPKKQASTKSSTYKRVILAGSSSSESAQEAKDDKEDDESSGSSDDSDLYGKDLQLFYIRMNNREEKEAKSKNASSSDTSSQWRVNKPAFLNNLTDSDESPDTSIAEIDDDELSRRIKELKFIKSNPTKDIFTTPIRTKGNLLI